MSDWFQDLHTMRKEMVRWLRLNKTERGIRNLTVDKYTDPIHFVYELLQNAEDQNASIVHFYLKENSLEFVHDGEPFQPGDVEGITNLGDSQKADLANKIGCFGIGFKSVFEITERPEIYTTLEGVRFAFAIEDQFIPVRLPVDTGLHEKFTRFVFPFPQSGSSFYAKIREKLRTLGADTLLFLDHLTTIYWETVHENGTYICERTSAPYEWCELFSEVRIKEGQRETEHRKYLRFSRGALVDSDRKNLTVRVAFRVEENHVKPEEGLGRLNVYFPTSEPTLLKFRLHAPMLLTDSRANIKTGNTVNRQLILDCAQLVAESLPLLKAKGLLDVGCLQCLPIRTQEFPVGSTFRPVYEAVHKALRTQPLLPTLAGSKVSHVIPADARISESATVRGLINQVQLTQLTGGSASRPVLWLSEEIRQKATIDLWDYVWQELGVVEIDLEKFAGMLDLSFLSRQTDAWMIQFYQALSSAPSLWKYGALNPRLRKKEIIRLQDNSHVVPFSPGEKPTAFLPTKTDNDFPTVKRVIVQDENALEFLRDLGIEAPLMVDRVIHSVLPRYSGNLALDEESYADDLQIIAEAIQSCDFNSRSALEQALKRTSFLLGYNPPANEYFWNKPMEVCQPTHELLHWFTGDRSVRFVADIVHKLPAWKVIEEFINRQSTTIRSTVRIRLSPLDTMGNAILSEARLLNKRGLQRFDPNAQIDGLEHALAIPTVQKAQTLWRILLLHHFILKGDVQTSRYKDYRNPTQDRMKSPIYDICTNNRWLLNRQGVLCKPSEISLFELPEGWESLSENAKALSAALDMKRVDVLEKERENREFEEFKRLRAEFLAWKRRQVALPESEETSQDRADKLADRQQQSPDVKYQMRLRSIRTSSRDLRETDRRYLMEYCEGPDGEMVCQICCEEMPFKIDGEYYFEATRFLKVKVQEVIRNKIALCPVCAAKWQHANPHTPAEIHQKLMLCNGNEIHVTLAGQSETVRFFKTQLGDLKAVLRNVTSED